MSEEGDNPFDLPADAKKYVDEATFEQILEMDDDDTREFSRQLVFGFFEQADTTFDEMDTYVESKDLAQLSALGHFLKGSSATLGLFKVRDSCEKIQHLGALKDETGDHDVEDEDECLQKIKDIIPVMKKDFKEAETWLKDFFGPEPEES